MQSLPELWGKAVLSERRRLLLTVLATVYVDTRGMTANVAIRPKAVFKPLFANAGAVTKPVESNFLTPRSF